MMTQEMQPDQQARVPDGSEYTAALRAAHSASGRAGISSRSLRSVYFSLSSIWGFIAGVAGLLVALSLFDQPVAPKTATIVALIPALGLAIVGGRVLAGAYEEARRRRR